MLFSSFTFCIIKRLLQTLRAACDAPLVFMRLANVCQARDKKKLAIFLSLHGVHVSNAFFGYLAVNVRALERRVHVAGDHFQLNAIHSQAHRVDFQAHPFNRGRTFLLIKAVGRLDQASNVMGRAYELFFCKARRCVLIFLGPILPVVLGTEMIYLGRRIAIVNEILVPSHVGVVFRRLLLLVFLLVLLQLLLLFACCQVADIATKANGERNDLLLGLLSRRW